MPIVMYKKRGETPLQTLDRLRIEQPQLKAEAMTYAGRLDPMAEGVLLVLVGEECKKKEEFLSLDKEYVCEILWGVSTDTYDVLGQIINTKKIEETDFFAIKNFDFQQFVGKFQQEFPPYSSKPVFGKPLHEWAREGRLSEIDVPAKEIEIYSLKCLETQKISSETILQNITNNIRLVKGDFRQDEIVSGWKSLFFENRNNLKSYYTTKILVVCGSGTYIRALVQEIGEKSALKACVYNLLRVKVGEYR